MERMKVPVGREHDERKGGACTYSMYVAALDVRDRGHTGSLVLPVQSISRTDRSNVMSHEPRND